MWQQLTAFMVHLKCTTIRVFGGTSAFYYRLRAFSQINIHVDYICIYAQGSKLCFVYFRTFLFLITLIESVFNSQLSLRQLIQPNLESRFVVMFHLVPNLKSGSSPCAGLQVVTQPTHLLKNCYPQMRENPHRSEILPAKQLDNCCMRSCTHAGLNVFETEYHKRMNSDRKNVELPEIVVFIIEIQIF